MNVIQAVDDTISLARDQGFDCLFIENESVSWDHLLEMQEALHNQEMSYGKQCRWLGWIQASVVAADVGINLDHCKIINKRNAQ